MSYTEVRMREGLPYGGMPHDAMLMKLEATDPALVANVHGYDSYDTYARAPHDDYDDYARSEIVDWTPDAAFLESDHTRRDPSISKSRLNLIYNGTRGSNPELPRHPELFYGFTGNDPRGVVNDPRFDVVRGHVTARAAGLTTRMGDNDDFHIAERPWTGQAISYAMKDIHRSLQKNTRVFSVSKEGRPWGRNTPADAISAGMSAGRTRLAAIGDGVEVFDVPVGGGARAGAPAAGGELGGEAAGFGAPGSAFAPGRHAVAGGDFGVGKTARAHGVGAPGVLGAPGENTVAGGDFGVGKTASTRGAGTPGDPRALGENTTADGEFGVGKIASARGAGSAVIGSGAIGGGRVANGGAAEHAWVESRAARSARRATLGATVAVAARHRAADRSARPDQTPGGSYETRSTPGGMAPGANVAALYRNLEADATQFKTSRTGGPAYKSVVPGADTGRTNRATEVSTTPNFAGTAARAGAGVAPGSDTGRAFRATEIAVTPNSATTNAAAIAAGFRGGSASDMRRIASAVVADGVRPNIVVEQSLGSAKTPAPGSDVGRAAAAGRAAFVVAAAGGLEVHSYGKAAKLSTQAPLEISIDSTTWRASREALPVGASRAPEWRSATQGQTALSSDDATTFGLATEDVGGHGAAPTGPKRLRAGGWSADADFADGIEGREGAFADGFNN